ncbi:MAG: outer membrane beta-barrel protein [Pseudomonadota bacterium]
MASAITLFLLGGLGADALAQQGRGDPTGIRAGAFIFRPVASLDTIYDSNVFFENADETDSVIINPRADLSVVSDFSRHRVSVEGYVDQRFFLQSSDDDQTEFGVSTQGVIDVTRDFRFVLDGSYDRIAERRGTDEADETDLTGPVLSDRFRGSVLAEYRVGDFRLRPRGFYDRQVFQDTGPVDQSARDRDIFGGSMEVGYRFSPGYEGFVRGGYEQVDFDEDDDVNRDSEKFGAGGGVRLRLSRLLFGSIGVGVAFEEFENPDFDSTTDLVVDTRLDWSPRQGLNVALAASRAINPTNVDGAADRVDTDVSLTARYEILRDLDGVARFTYEQAQFEGLGRTDNFFAGRVGLERLITRRASLSIGYEYGTRTSNFEGQDFTKHLALVGVNYGF